MKKLVALVFIAVLLSVTAAGWWNSQLAPVGSDKEEKQVVIPKGSSLGEIADILKKEGLIRSSLVFKLYARQQGAGGKLQAGLYRLSSNMSAPELVKSLIKGPRGVWVRFLEGWRVEEMADELNSKFKIQNSKFIKLAEEGYMFPDTYLFPLEATESYIVELLEDNFKNKFTDNLRLKIKSQGLTEEQGVILASIVEREARSDGARKMVAGILLKRFKIGMGLNADATVQYALGYQPLEKSWWKRNLTEEDKKTNSQYNTYLHAGLPPAPIGNPGLSSLQAVANADSSTLYLYYYHDSKGNSHYAKTLEEHNENVAKYP